MRDVPAQQLVDLVGEDPGAWDKAVVARVVVSGQVDASFGNDRRGDGRGILGSDTALGRQLRPDVPPDRSAIAGDLPSPALLPKPIEQTQVLPPWYSSDLLCACGS